MKERKAYMFDLLLMKNKEKIESQAEWIEVKSQTAALFN